jgi:hypothetical protein
VQKAILHPVTGRLDDVEFACSPLVLEQTCDIMSLPECELTPPGSRYVAF